MIRPSLDLLYEDVTTDIFESFTEGELSQCCDRILTATRTAMSLIEALPGPPISVVLDNPLNLFTPERHLPQCRHDIDEVFRGIEDAVAGLKSRARPLERDVESRYPLVQRRFVVQLAKEMRAKFKKAHLQIVADITNAYFFHDARNDGRFPRLDGQAVRSISRKHAPAYPPLR